MLTAVLAREISIYEYFKPPFENPGELISILLPNLYILAGVILFILLLAGGFGIIINAGKGQQEGVAKSGKLVTAAVMGFLIIIASYFLIQIVNYIVAINIFTGQPYPGQPTPAFPPPTVPPTPDCVPIGGYCRSAPVCCSLHCDYSIWECVPLSGTPRPTLGPSSGG